jgi:hypothetical protein
MVLRFLLIIAELRCSGSSPKELAVPQARERKIKADDSLVSSTAVPALALPVAGNGLAIGHRICLTLGSPGQCWQTETQGRGLGRQRFGRSLSRKSQCR